jgi:hypothetical protein
MDDFKRNRDRLSKGSWQDPAAIRLFKKISRRHARHNLKEQDRATLKKYRAIRF